jgi:hypothetical protein
LNDLDVLLVFTIGKEIVMAQTINPTQRKQGFAVGSDQPEPQRHSEGVVARSLEDQTARLPSDIWLWAALGSMGVSLAMQLSDRKRESLFIGQWAAPLLLIGVYNKLVKVAGSDRLSDSRR